MKLVKQTPIIKVKAVYDCEGYEEDREYCFSNIEDVIDFLDDKTVTDLYGDSRSKSYYENIDSIEETARYYTVEGD